MFLFGFRCLLGLSQKLKVSDVRPFLVVTLISINYVGIRLKYFMDCFIRSIFFILKKSLDNESTAEMDARGH